VKSVLTISEMRNWVFAEAAEDARHLKALAP
jgi:hypothetical protein